MSLPYNGTAMLSLPFRPTSSTVSTVSVESSPYYNSKDVAAVTYDDLIIPAAEIARYRSERVRIGEERSNELKVKNARKRYLELNPEYFSSISLALDHPVLYYRLVQTFQTAAEREEAGRNKPLSEQMTANIWRVEAEKESAATSSALFDVPTTKEEGMALWVDEMTQRFLRGEDSDFDYKKVDGMAKYDDPEEERDHQDAYFDSMDSDFDSDGEGKEKVLTGETGVQDY